MFKNYLKIKNWILKISAMSALVLVFSAPALLFAQTDYIPLAPLPNTVLLPDNKTQVPECNPLNENAYKPGTSEYKEKCKLSSTNALPRYLTGLYKTGIAAAGILAVLMLVWGGFQYMTTEAVSGKSESKGIIMNVVWGLATVLASYLLLYTINPRLVDIGLALENLRPVTKTRIPTAQETYGVWLDNELKKLQDISKEARDIKKESDGKRLERGQLQQKIDEGDYADDAELENIQSKINNLDKEIGLLDVQEVNVRSYKDDVVVINQKQTNIQDCLTGKGICDRPGWVRSVTGFRSASEIAADQEYARQQLEGLRGIINTSAQKLRTAGLTAQANDLTTKFQQTELMYDFFTKCPNASVRPAGWKKTDSCP